MPIDESIIAKVKKLFALAADNSNQNESHVALEMARKLMRDHGISQVDVETISVSDINVQEWRSDWLSQIDTYSKYLANAVAKLFNCQYYTFKSGAAGGYKVRVCFAGEETDMALAVETWPWLVKKAKQYAKFQYGSGWTPQHRCYAEGFASRIYARAVEMTEQEQNSDNADDQKYGIVVMKKFDALTKFFERAGYNFKFSKPRYRGSYDHRANQAGAAAANAINLNFRPQINAKPANQKLLN